MDKHEETANHKNPINGMVSYDFRQSVEHISYSEMEFKSFVVREVYINGKQKGEFHIRPKGNKSPENAVIFLRQYFPQCSLDLIDPSGLLNLEYPIYLICKGNPMIIDSIQQVFEKVDEDIGNG